MVLGVTTRWGLKCPCRGDGLSSLRSHNADGIALSCTRKSTKLVIENWSIILILLLMSIKVFWVLIHSVSAMGIDQLVL